jgi:hypothetical protein
MDVVTRQYNGTTQCILHKVLTLIWKVDELLVGSATSSSSFYTVMIQRYAVANARLVSKTCLIWRRELLMWCGWVQY